MAPAAPDTPEPRFKIEVERRADSTVVHCRGRSIAGLTETFHAEVKPLLAAKQRIVLDLTELTRMDSMGLGAMVSLAISAKRAECRLELVNLGKQVRQLFAIANLLALFEPAGDNTFRIP